MRWPRLSRPSSIAGRLTAFSASFVAGAILVASVILWLIVAGVVREQIDQRLDTQIEGLRSGLTMSENGQLMLASQLDGPPFDRPNSGWYWQIKSETSTISSRSLERRVLKPGGRPADWRDLASARPRPGDMEDDNGRGLYTRTLFTRINGQPVQITASAPDAALTDPAFRSLMWLVPAMALLGITLLIGTYLQVRFGLKPLKRLTTDIGEVSAGNRSTLSEGDVEELQPVSTEINRLIALNERRLEEARIHFANMAHGLKTPVASLTLGLNDDNDANGGLRDLVQRIDRRIRHHLADARKSAAGQLSSRHVLLRPRLDDLILVLSNIYRDKALSIRCEVEDQTSLRCDAEDVDEVLGNLLDNAFKWASTAVTVSSVRKGGFVEITMTDDGPGISEDRINEAFQPGMRLDESIQGSGFGLGISKEIAELYGGTVRLQNSESGFQAIVTLPISSHISS
ncbi:signal transduction histidine kinase [Agrobacterium larrymoorei]|uniref:histidine kinase n=1 Tax=Agrobacterium larrymoorei TaxID=160699 RepID=A0AAJ2BI76_9HYPH|nr:HAMP domain-containing sensor histidine kinase [Agrobacterium larrymoorei]MDR6100085.1 signal transduction histidine kinase [Agrobacterium larrymoorei]